MAHTTYSKAELVKAHDRLQSMRNRIGNLRKQAEATTEKLVRTAEVGGTAFLAGVVQGRGGIEVMGVPIDLGGGLALNLLGYFGAAGKMSDHLINVGDGALAAYFTSLGFGVGKEMESKGGILGSKETKTISKGATLSPEEIQAATMGVPVPR